MGAFANFNLQRRQLVIAGFVLAAILALLITAYFVLLRRPYQVLFSDLRASDAATIVAELDKKKTPYRLADGGRTILVPPKLVDATRLSVMSEDLPIKGTVGFELFNKSDMGLTEFAQQINYRRALQGELARTIMALDGIDSVRVHLTVADPAVFREDKRPSKASVTLIPRKGVNLPRATVRGVQSLVAAAVPDLDAAHVVILDEHGEIISPATPDAALDGIATSGRDRFEDSSSEVIRSALRRRFGDALVDVSVAAPLAQDVVSPQAQDAAQERSLAPRARNFPMAVHLVFDAPLSAQMRSEAQQVAIAAVGLDPNLGDSLEIRSLARPDGTAGGGAVANTAAPATPAPLWRPLAWLPPASQIVLCVLSAALLAIALWPVVRRRLGSAALSLDQKRAYALRLESLLAEEEGTAHG